MNPRPSPAGALVFFAVRSASNAVRRRLRRLTEARYLVGLTVALGYIAFVLVRPGRPSPRGAAAAGPWPVELTTVVQLGAAAALLFGAALVWLFRGSDAALSLTEGEAEFLFSAPVERRTVVHFSLLRSQLRVLSGVLIALLFSRPASTAGLLRSALGGWILFSTINLHLLGVGFTKAAWKERGAARRRTMTGLSTLLALAVLVFTLAGVTEVVVRATAVAGRRGPGVVAVESALVSGTLGRTLLAVLVPLRAVVAPLFAATPSTFAAALPAALLLLALHYVWVIRTNARYEDATIEGAARRAARRARQRGELAALPGEEKRKTVPFVLAPSGHPEVAIFWKNLAAWNRTPVKTQIRWLLLVGAFLGVAGVLSRSPAADRATSIILIVVAAIAPILAMTLPSGLRLDLRRDLASAAVLRSWPIGPVGLVVAEVAAPFWISVLILFGGVFGSLALSVGRALRGAANIAGPLGGLDAPERLVPAALAAFLIVPPLSLLLVLGQNAATLAFPAWFPPGPQRSRGLEQMGISLLTAFVSLAALALALIPAVALAALVLFLGGAALGPWALPLGALFGSLPLWAEAVGVVFLLAKMWERFDPSLDLPD
jgi:ABC-2 type transport system permease protein